MKRNIALSAFCLLAPTLIGSSVALGQTTPTTGSTVVYPQDNVSGGAIAARRPGLRVEAGISQVTKLIAVNTQQHGGANPQPQTGTKPRTVFLTDFLNSLFATLQALATALAVAASVSTTPTTNPAT
jgi:hypothetical protein